MDKDVMVADHGSVVMIHPVSDAAKTWVDENVPTEGWQWMGTGFACEPRYVMPLLKGMVEDGLSIGGGL